jgi:Methyltransferase domain
MVQKTISFDAVRRSALKVIDLSVWLFAALSALVAKVQWRCGGPQNLPHSFRAWNALGVLPVPFHYYHPAFDPEMLPDSVWARESPLPGLDLRVDAQLNLLRQFGYCDELRGFPLHGEPRDGFSYFNRMFGPGDAEILYSVIRYFKPERVIEIGSGYSTLLAEAALERNRREGHHFEHICIEPYPEPWLENVNSTRLIRQRIETMDPAFFEQLGANDILFVDSSHVVRTGGDVQFEYLEVLPRLHSGVLVHAHDIFLPFEYPLEWVRDKKFFWTEQYLLQAFLAFNSAFEVVLALSYLHRHHRVELACAAPVYAEHASSRPGSLWMRRKLT